MTTPPPRNSGRPRYIQHSAHINRAATDAGVASGRIRYREDIVDGLENAPGAFGKLIVRVARNDKEPDHER